MSRTMPQLYQRGNQRKIWGMPISAIYNIRGGTLAHYDRIIAALGKHANSPGGIAHIAAATPDGILVCDIWESQEALDNFARHLGPLAEAAGIGSQNSPLMGRVENMSITENDNDMPAVAILYSIPGMSVARYRELLSQVKFEGSPSTARRAHIACETAEGMFIVALWESEAAFRAFEPAINAAFAATGVNGASPVIGQIHRAGFMPGAFQSVRA